MWNHSHGPFKRIFYCSHYISPLLKILSFYEIDYYRSIEFYYYIKIIPFGLKSFRSMFYEQLSEYNSNSPEIFSIKSLLFYRKTIITTGSIIQGTRWKYIQVTTFPARFQLVKSIYKPILYLTRIRIKKYLFYRLLHKILY